MRTVDVSGLIVLSVGLVDSVSQPGWMTTSTLGLFLSDDDPLMLSTDFDDEVTYA